MRSPTSFKACIAIACIAYCVLGHGKDLTPGTLLSSANIDAVLNDSFEGSSIRSLLTRNMLDLIRKHGLTLKLAASRPIEVDARWIEASRKNAATVTFDPESRTVKGWRSGLPFPQIDAADRNAGDKIAWNARYGLLEGHSGEEPYIAVYLLDLDKGVERIQSWSLVRVMMTARVDAPGSTGDPGIFAKTLLLLRYPQDIRGIGSFSIRHVDTRKFDDSWVYINQFRRVKRVSGGGWMDPLGGGVDALQEDLNVWDAPPNWYPSVKLIGKRRLLVVAHAGPPLDDARKHEAAEMRQFDLQNQPYFNTRNAWEPREVYELEVTPLPEHPYGKRMVYIDAQLFQAYHSEIYDHAGQFWKLINYERAPITGKDGFKGYSVLQGRFVDFKRRHATVWASRYVMNDPAVNARTVSMEALEREGAR